MRRSCLLLLASLVSLWGHAAAQGEPSPPPLSVAQYTQALDDSLSLAQKLGDDPSAATDLRQSLPETSWHVRDAGRDYEIPAKSLRHNVEEWERTKSETSQRNLLAHLDTLRAGVEAYEKAPNNASARRSLLNTILSRPEFSGVRGPGWLDPLKQRIARFLLHLLGRAFQSSVFPLLSDIVVYGLIILAVLGVAYWMYRSLRESANLETIMPHPVPVSAKQWPLWLQEARAAAARGDFREAVHLTYWSGISFLEAQGAWRPDSARTPREYLRLLPANSERQPALRSLTNRLELVWYGMGDVNSEVFQQSLAELEKLGCPCN